MSSTFVLSPHYDDAALSCGGLLARWAEAGRAAVVLTLFAGKPNYATLSPFARRIHARPLAREDLIEQRQAEEARALALLGTRSVFGPWLDCIYRCDAAGTRWLTPDESALFAAPDPEDEMLIAALADWVQALVASHRSSQLIAPLAIGNHIDHQLTWRAALLLHQRGMHVRFYADYPYAVRDPDGLAAGLARLNGQGLGTWHAQRKRLNAAQVARKIAAVSAYASQLEVLFPGEGPVSRRVADAIEAFARQCGNGARAELLITT